MVAAKEYQDLDHQDLGAQDHLDLEVPGHLADLEAVIDLREPQNLELHEC